MPVGDLVPLIEAAEVSVIAMIDRPGTRPTPSDGQPLLLEPKVFSHQADDDLEAQAVRERAAQRPGCCQAILICLCCPCRCVADFSAAWRACCPGMHDCVCGAFGSIAGVASLALFYADVGSDALLALELARTSNPIWAGLTLAFISLQYFAAYLGVLLYLRSVYSAWSCTFVGFLLVGFPLGPLVLDVLMFLEPINLMCLLPSCGLLCLIPSSQLHYLLPAYRSTRTLLEVTLESLPQSILQAYIYYRLATAPEAAGSLSHFPIATLEVSLSLSFVSFLKAWIGGPCQPELEPRGCIASSLSAATRQLERRRPCNYSHESTPFELSCAGSLDRGSRPADGSARVPRTAADDGGETSARASRGACVQAEERACEPTRGSRGGNAAPICHRPQYYLSLHARLLYVILAWARRIRAPHPRAASAPILFLERMCVRASPSFRPPSARALPPRARAQAGLPINALRRNAISEFICQFTLSDRQVEQLATALEFNTSLRRIQMGRLDLHSGVRTPALALYHRCASLAPLGCASLDACRPPVLCAFSVCCTCVVRVWCVCVVCVCGQTATLDASAWGDGDLESSEAMLIAAASTVPLLASLEEVTVDAGGPLPVKLLNGCTPATTVDLTSRRLGPHSARMVGALLRANRSATPRTLLLPNNNLTAHGDDMEGLRMLCGGITACRGLANINLSNNFICGAKASKGTLLEGIEAVAHAVEQSQSLTSLTLGNNRLGDRGASVLAAAMKSSALTAIDLCENGISRGGAKALSAAMGQMECLRTINLRSNAIDSEAIKPIASAMEASRSLTEVNLSNNFLRVRGTKELAAVVAKSGTLRSLNLANNALTDDGARALAPALAKSRTLVYLDARNNGLTADTKKLLKQSASGRGVETELLL